MKLKIDEKHLIRPFKWIVFIVVCFGLLVASFVFYSLYEFKAVHQQSLESVVETLNPIFEQRRMDVHTSDLAAQELENMNNQFHIRTDIIQWAGYLLIGITSVLILGLIFSVRKIEKDNTSKLSFIAENKMLYSKVVETMPDALLLIDNETGAILEANPAAELLYGYSTDELLKMRNVDLSAEPNLTKEASKGTLREIPLRYHQTRAGQIFPVEIKASRFEWHGRGVHMAWIHDISERIESEKSMEKALQEAKAAERSKSSFLSNISHEIRTPLNGIYGSLQFLKLEEGNKESIELHTICQDATIGMIQLMDQIIEFSKLESGIFDLYEVELCLNHVLEEVCRLLLPFAYAKQVNVEFVNNANPVQMVGDAFQIKQVAMHLISNAIKFNDVGGKVKVQASENIKDNQVTIVISDTGCGIKNEDYERIFRGFEQGDLSKTKTHGGIGLGLATAKGIVAYLGGEILVESVFGQGSTFTIKLPKIK